MIPLERASQEEQNDAIFRFIAPSSEELWVRKQVGLNNTIWVWKKRMDYSPWCLQECEMSSCNTYPPHIWFHEEYSRVLECLVIVSYM